MPQDVTKELSAIPFGSLIGGPLTAAIDAQAQAAYSSVEFINAIGFDDNGSVQNISFNYEGPGDVGRQSLEVPLLTIVPIPFIRIDDMTIQFKASMSQSTGTEDKQSNIVEKNAKISGSARYLFFRASLDASISSKKDSTSTKNSKYSVEYTIDVNVHAVQDDMPGGMAKVLSILTDSISQSAASPQQPKPKDK
jgi:hypothetical protein